VFEAWVCPAELRKSHEIDLALCSAEARTNPKVSIGSNCEVSASTGDVRFGVRSGMTLPPRGWIGSSRVGFGVGLL
jgi:hypothetical protein